VKHHNERNLGILVMGNYESQRPTEIQLAAIKQLLQSRCTAYGISPSRVYTHRELRPTACPGRYLQPRLAAIRNTLA
jgi:N-acetyl-anhydromuramyl-L-alanine amidase AmpD